MTQVIPADGGLQTPVDLDALAASAGIAAEHVIPYGRDVALNGYPLKIGNILAQLDGTCLVTRQSVQTPAAVRKTKKMLRLAFENSMAGKGTSVVEVVSTCSSGWKKSPTASNRWMEENMFPAYPLGDLKNI